MKVEIKDGDEVPTVGSLFPLVSSRRSYNASDLSSIFILLKKEIERKNIKNKSKKRSKGRSLIATKDIKQGELLFSEEPFSFRVTYSMVSKICNYTLSSPLVESILKHGEPGHCKLLKETRSNAAWFKNKEALALAWKKGHKEYVEGINFFKKRGILFLFLIMFV